MDAVAESVVTVLVAVQAEFLRFVVEALVAVGGAGDDGNGLSDLDLLAVELQRFVGRTHQKLHRTVIAKGLFDAGFDEVGLLLERRPEVGTLRQHVQQVAEQVGRGFIAGDE